MPTKKGKISVKEYEKLVNKTRSSLAKRKREEALAKANEEAMAMIPETDAEVEAESTASNVEEEKKEEPISAPPAPPTTTEVVTSPPRQRTRTEAQEAAPAASLAKNESKDTTPVRPPSPTNSIASDAVDYEESEEGEVRPSTPTRSVASSPRNLPRVSSPPPLSPPPADFDRRTRRVHPAMPPSPRPFKRCSCCVPIWSLLSDEEVDSMTGYIDTRQTQFFHPLFEIGDLARHPTIVGMNLTSKGQKRYVVDLFFRLRFFSFKS